MLRQSAAQLESVMFTADYTLLFPIRCQASLLAILTGKGSVFSPQVWEVTTVAMEPGAAGNPFQIAHRPL
jgi:hypothetical protein